MPKLTADQQDKYLVFLQRSRRKAVTAMWGALLTALCLILLIYLSKRTYVKEQFENNTRSDVVGVLLGASAFITLIGGSLSAWLIFDTAAEQRRLTGDRQNVKNRS